MKKSGAFGTSWVRRKATSRHPATPLSDCRLPITDHQPPPHFSFQHSTFCFCLASARSASPSAPLRMPKPLARASQVQNSFRPESRCRRRAAATCRKSALPAFDASADWALNSSAASITDSARKSLCQRSRACVRSPRPQRFPSHLSVRVRAALAQSPLFVPAIWKPSIRLLQSAFRPRCCATAPPSHSTAPGVLHPHLLDLLLEELRALDRGEIPAVADRVELQFLFPLDFVSISTSFHLDLADFIPTLVLRRGDCQSPARAGRARCAGRGRALSAARLLRPAV